MLRKTDSYNEPVHFQMGRFAQQNSEWFYMTRERIERGPFDSKEDASDDLITYLRHRNNFEKSGY